MSTGSPEPRRFSIPLCVSLSTVMLSLAAVFAGNPTEEESDDDAPLPDQQVSIADSGVYRWLNLDASDAATARTRLKTLLQKKIAIIDQVCKLTDTQKEMLELAGRGDNKRLLDRIAEIGTQLPLVINDSKKVNDLRDKAQSLQRGQLGIFNCDSQFIKLLEKRLTAEQLTRYEPLRVVIHAGGLIQTRQRRADEGLAVLLTGATIADDDLAHLSELPNLQDLSLAGPRVTDVGLAHLKGLSNLYLLSLFRTGVTDAGLVHLKGLTGLQDLTLTGAQVTSAGLAHVKGLPKLEYLALNSTHVNDAGLVHLSALTGLRGLALDSTPVTDKGMAYLRPLKNLQQLSLAKTHVTDAGIAELKRALPGLRVTR